MRCLFHLAFQVTDLDAARRFYGGVLGCQEGRSTDTWVDFDFFGHQISLHLGTPFASTRTGHVGDHLVPMPHFGAILELPDWHALAARLKAAGTAFVLEPQVRFEGQPGEQWTMFFYDPSGNPIEIKGFRSLDAVYAASGGPPGPHAAFRRHSGTARLACTGRAVEGRRHRLRAGAAGAL